MKKSTILFLILLFLLVAPLFLALHNDVYLNQFMLQTTWIGYGSFSELPSFLRSAYSLGWRLLLTVEKPLLNATDPQETLAYLFQYIPHHAYVYPTETYYYYKFPLGNLTYAGNFRLLDAHEGKLHIGYYNLDQPHGDIYYTLLDADDGIYITPLDNFTFAVTYNNMERIFHLSPLASQPPQQLRTLPEEEFIAHIIDESGIVLFLLYNTNTSSFYYVLDEEKPAMDNFYKLPSSYFLGQRTSYIFYKDQEYARKILVGVSQNNIYLNNYYDGPFDQVPPRLYLKEKLEAAYPYTKYAGGIDEHGNFYSFAGSRVAISPYLDYNDTANLFSYLDRCDSSSGKSIYWSCLTYEWKKDFHKTLEQQSIQQNLTSSSDTHALYFSQGWPANHDGQISLQWPVDHTADVSSSWQPSHLTSVSLDS